jgi:hypothetical protein
VLKSKKNVSGIEYVAEDISGNDYVGAIAGYSYGSFKK